MTDNCIQLIKHYERLYLKAYLDPVKIPTIGYGTIVYPTGKRVKMGDICTEEQAIEWLNYELEQNLKYVNSLKLNENQVDACMSFIYNCGSGNFNISSLKKKIIKNPSDPTIEHEFLKWVHAGGMVLQGLVYRRKSEWDLYSKGKLIYYN